MSPFLFLALASCTQPKEIGLQELDLTRVQQGWGTPQANRSVSGKPLSIHGRSFASGLGTHSLSLIAVELDGNADRFTAWAGIDDAADGPGEAEFLVLAQDGRVIVNLGILRKGDDARRVDVSLKGLKALYLVVDTGRDGFAYDHSDWAEAKFTFNGAVPKLVKWGQGDPSPKIAPYGFPAKPVIHAPTMIGANAGRDFIFTVPATGSKPLAFRAKGLPDGLSLNKTTGIVSGKPKRAGNYSVDVAASNGQGTVSKKFKLVVGNKVALTPPLGWNSYDSFNDSVTEDETLANARQLVKLLKPLGWQFVVVDFRWYDPKAAPREVRQDLPNQIDDYGRLVPAVKRFPSSADGNGFKSIAEKVHAMGLRFGIHIMRGISRRAVDSNTPIAGSSFTAKDAVRNADVCGWNQDMYGVQGNTPAGQAWYDSIIRQYASWGIDFIKVDDCSQPYHKDEIEAIRRAIDKCGRTIVFSLSPGPTPVVNGTHVATQANMWRTTGDYWDNWPQLNDGFKYADDWMALGGPGAWPDNDMLPLGYLGPRCPVGPSRQTNFTKAEQITHMSLWAIMPSPLMMGGNLSKLDDWTLALLGNEEVLAVNQDSLGRKGHRVWRKDGAEVWAKELEDGSLAVGLFNRSFLQKTISVTWAELGLTGTHKVRDLWLKKDFGTKTKGFSVSVPSHGAFLYRVSKKG